MKRTQKKKSLFDLLVRNTPQIDIYKITSLEHKLLSIMETQSEQNHRTGIEVLAHNPQLLKFSSCRICLNTTHLCSPIFTENSNPNYNITLLEKISQCANVNVRRCSIKIIVLIIIKYFFCRFPKTMVGLIKSAINVCI